jgi:hypothetical protein
VAISCLHERTRDKDRETHCIAYRLTHRPVVSGECVSAAFRFIFALHQSILPCGIQRKMMSVAEVGVGRGRKSRCHRRPRNSNSFFSPQLNNLNRIIIITFERFFRTILIDKYYDYRLPLYSLYVGGNKSA